MAWAVGGCSRGLETATRSRQLSVFNWSDYIHEEALARFEEKAGCTVVYDNYSSDSELETRLATAAGSYDVVFPSDRALAALLAKKLLQPLDRTRLSNFRQLDPQFLSPPVDPENQFSVPYFWGTLAVGVRTDKTTQSVGGGRSHAEGGDEGSRPLIPSPSPRITGEKGAIDTTRFASSRMIGSLFSRERRTEEKEERAQGWDALFDPRNRGRITMLDDMENVVAAALSYLGFPLNSVEPDHLAAAEKSLVEQRKLVQAYTSDSYRERLISGEAWASLGWSGDLMQADGELQKGLGFRVQGSATGQGIGDGGQGTGDRGEAARVRTIVPETGTMLWFDSMVIPGAARNVELAHEFIDHLLDPAIAALNAEKVNYATPNLGAKALLPPKMLADESIYPRAEVLKRCEWLRNRGAAIERIERVWRVVRG
jgi:spermidine/putrescine-binding protein